SDPAQAAARDHIACGGRRSADPQPPPAGVGDPDAAVAAGRIRRGSVGVKTDEVAFDDVAEVCCLVEAPDLTPIDAVGCRAAPDGEPLDHGVPAADGETVEARSGRAAVDL